MTSSGSVPMKKLLFLMMAAGIFMIVAAILAADYITVEEEDQVAILVRKDSIIRVAKDCYAIAHKGNVAIVANETCAVESTRVSKICNEVYVFTSAEQVVDVFLIGRAELGKVDV